MDDVAATKFRTLCRAVVAGALAPYDAAREMWNLGMANAAKDEQADDVAWAHWLIWGALTDWIDSKPCEQTLAEATIVDAAKGWLVVEEDPVARKAYLDRMVYDVCGYARPSGPPSN
jgi:hypothetical protein